MNSLYQAASAKFNSFPNEIEPLADEVANLVSTHQYNTKNPPIWCCGTIEGVPSFEIKNSNGAHSWSAQYPIVGESAERLVREATIPSKQEHDPYHEGLQIEPSKCEFDPNWSSLFTASNTSALLTSVKAQMAQNSPNCNVRAEFMRLEIHDQGGYHKRHADPSINPTHFATLVVFLPTQYEGGDILFTNKGITRSFRLGLQPAKCDWLVYYSDGEYEIKPVTNGYRVTLIYYLFHEGDAKPQPGPMATPELIGRLVSLLHSDPSISTVGIPLESLYLTGLPAPNLLKGADSSLFVYLWESSQFDLTLKPIKVVETGKGFSEKDKPEESRKEALNKNLSISYEVTEIPSKQLYGRLTRGGGHAERVGPVLFLSSLYTTVDSETHKRAVNPQDDTKHGEFEIHYAMLCLLLKLKSAASPISFDLPPYSLANLDKDVPKSGSLKRKRPNYSATTTVDDHHSEEVVPEPPDQAGRPVRPHNKDDEIVGQFIEDVLRLPVKRMAKNQPHPTVPHLKALAAHFSVKKTGARDELVDRLKPYVDQALAAQSSGGNTNGSGTTTSTINESASQIQPLQLSQAPPTMMQQSTPSMGGGVGPQGQPSDQLNLLTLASQQMASQIPQYFQGTPFINDPHQQQQQHQQHLPKQE